MRLISTERWRRCTRARTAGTTSTPVLRRSHPGAACSALARGISRLTDSSRRVESREALAVWLCKQHNVVNEKLGKPVFPCDFAALDRRWRTGAPGCFEEAGTTSAESLGQEEE